MSSKMPGDELALSLGRPDGASLALKIDF